jgi:transposase InsO family protein
VNRRLRAVDVIDALSDLLILRGIPGHNRSDNGPEFIAKVLRDWIAAVGARTAYIEPGSPWENGYCEIFYTLNEAKVVIEGWCRQYNTERRTWLWAIGHRRQPPSSGPPQIRGHRHL